MLYRFRGSVEFKLKWKEGFWDDEENVVLG